MFKQPTISKIMHISDLHFFRHKRFKEHAFAVKELVKKIKQDKIDLVYIGGDVVDSKTTLSPEQIQGVINLLSSIGNLVPIIMIPGNHDLLLNAKSGLDSLTPIVNMVQTIHPIYYLTESGIYTLYNIDWCVWSCIDERNPFDIGIKVDNVYRIGCFHAPIQGCQTDIGFSDFKNATSIDVFKDCQTVFLGDIHKRSFFRNNEIAYSGSIIQCNSGESELKGGIIWEWKNNKFVPETFNINTPYGFKVFKLKDLDVDLDKLLVPAEIQSKTMVFKYVGEPSSFSLSKFRELKRKVKVLFKDNDVILQNDFNKKKAKESKTVKEVSLPSQYIDIFLKNEELTKEEIQAIKELDAAYDRQVNSKEYATGEYFIERLIVSNFLCYGENQVLDLDLLEGITGIFGKNGVGKTSAIAAIMFCLFNKCPKDVPVYKLINDKLITDKVNCFVELTLRINGSLWRIRRSIAGVKSKKQGKVTLEVYETVNGIEAERHEESRPKTDANLLRNLLGDELTFLRTSYWEQKNSSEFIDAKNAEKLDLFIKFLGITIYDEKFDAVAIDLKEQETLYNSKKVLLEKEDSITVIEKEKISLEERLKTKQEEVKVSTEEKKKLNSKHSALTKRTSELNTVDIKDSEVDLEKQLIILQQEQKDKQLQLEERVKKSKELIDLWNFDKNRKGKLDIWEKDYVEINQLTQEDQTLIRELESISHKLEKETCPTCNQNWVTVTDKDSLIRRELEIRDRQKEIFLTIEKLKEENRVTLSLKTSVKEIDTKITLLKSNLETLESKTLNIQQKIELLKANKVKIELKKELDIDLKALNKLIDTNRTEIANSEALIVYTKKDIDKVNKRITDYNSLLGEMLLLETKVKYLSIYKRMVHRNGVPSLILESYIPAINEEMNDLLKDLFDFIVTFELSDGYLEVYFNYPLSEKRYAVQACGMEGIIINLAIRAALTKISFLPKPSLLMLDEVFAMLDKENIVKMKELILNLKNQFYNIILISHVEDMFDLPQHFVKLTQTNGVTLFD